MDTLKKSGSLGLASRLKRVSDTLFSEVEAIYQNQGIEISPRVFAIFHALSLDERISVTELAAMLRLSHPAIVQLTRELEEQGFIKSTSDSKDKRRTLYHLSKKGHVMLLKVSPLWDLIRTELDRRIENSNVDFLKGLGYLEDSLQEQSFATSVIAATKRNPVEVAGNVVIAGWSDKFKPDFERLNVEWLHEYGFEAEAIDVEYFADPRGRILEKGGAIFFALFENTVVGTCAILAREDKTFELAKMGINREFRRRGIGNLLMNAVIQHASARGFEQLYLETNRKLGEAIKLYKKFGFVETDIESHYKRVDLTMMLQF